MMPWRFSELLSAGISDVVHQRQRRATRRQRPAVRTSPTAFANFKVMGEPSANKHAL